MAKKRPAAAPGRGAQARGARPKAATKPASTTKRAKAAARSTTPRTPRPRDDDDGEDRRPARPLPPFPVVGMGASAGGLEAFMELFSLLPKDAGLSYVVIQHLDPSSTSFLPEALQRATAMPILEVREGLELRANHVYVIAPACDIALDGRRLIVTQRPADARAPHLPIDHFFRSLAEQARSRAIGIVLSGVGADGTEGLRAIEAENGVTIVQEPATAKFAAMPRSAESAGVADFVLPLAGIAEELVRLARHPFVAGDGLEPFGGRFDGDSLEQVFTLLRQAVGVDFREYKDTTLRRRMARRMALRKTTRLSDYLAVLRAEPNEVRALFDDVLVHVTSFFRDPEMFEVLKDRIFPEIVKHKPPGQPVRMWVAGCATGEEVYSLAMAFLEYASESHEAVPLQVFGSDVSEQAIERARAGVYPESVMREVGVDRVRRFFSKVDGGFRIAKSVRDLCVFVRHDLARDPPFSRLDLASCRNVLIYFNPPLQKRVIGTLHYCLNQPGYLLLGHTENVSGHPHLFAPVDKVHKIFARTNVTSTMRFPAPTEPTFLRRPLVGLPEPTRPVDLPKHVDNLLLSQYAPAGVIVNESFDILQFRGRTGPYLEPAPGTPQNNLLKMAREGLVPDLRVALGRVKKEQSTVRRDGVQVKQPAGGVMTCNLVVFPLAGVPDVREPMYVVLFEEAGTRAPALTAQAAADGAAAQGRARSGRSSSGGGKAKRDASARELKRDAQAIARLEHELKSTKEYLQSLVEEHQRTNDELTSTNEELVSSNEELQSMNEELETAKEELQSAHEELTTVNDELHNRNQEMGQLNNDLSNILSSVEIPLVILDGARRIRRFTPKARAIMNLVPSDIGRPIDDIRTNVNVPDLEEKIAEVIETMATKESEVQDKHGRWHRIQIRPYKTAENRIDGAILSLIDIDALKKALAAAEQARAEAEAANKAKDLFLATVSHELRTPLSTMLMQAQLLKTGELEDAEMKLAAEAIEQSTKIQAQLVDDLLDVSRIVTGRLTVDLKPISLLGVVRAAVAMVAPLAKKKSIAIVQRLGELPLQVSGDFARLQQVVWNVLANAVKFTPSGGRVEIALAAGDGQAVLQVTDDGEGIDPAFLPRVFSRFSQAESTVTRAHGGLGLGLSIAHHIVESHDGTIRAESDGKGKGTTITITLPLLVAALAPPAREGGADARFLVAAPLLKGRRVLVIDDDVGSREALALALRRTGAIPVVATSAAEAMHLLERGDAFDVLVCDIAMPDVDGLSFLRHVRALDRPSARVPAVAFTAFASDADRARSLQAGFQRHVTKPADVAVVLSTLAELCALDGARR